MLLQDLFSCVLKKRLPFPIPSRLPTKYDPFRVIVYATLRPQLRYFCVAVVDRLQIVFVHVVGDWHCRLYLPLPQIGADTASLQWQTPLPFCVCEIIDRMYKETDSKIGIGDCVRRGLSQCCCRTFPLVF
jgi:hypothetical protein